MEGDSSIGDGEAATIAITVKFSGGLIPISVSPDSTIKHLKSLLQPLTNVLPRGQKLIFKGFFHFNPIPFSCFFFFFSQFYSQSLEVFVIPNLNYCTHSCFVCGRFWQGSFWWTKCRLGLPRSPMGPRSCSWLPRACTKGYFSVFFSFLEFEPFTGIGSKIYFIGI